MAGRLRRGSGEGSIFQRCEKQYGCPPAELVIGEDGKKRWVRPKHRCRGLWVGKLDQGKGPDGKRRRPQVASPSRAETIKKLNELREKIARTGVATKKVKTENWLRHWLDEITDVGPNSKRTYRTMVTQHLIPGVGHHWLDELEPSHLRELYKHMKKNGKTGSRPATHATIRAALSAAEREGKITRNVAGLVTPPAGLNRERPALHAADGRKLLRYANRVDDGQLVNRLASRWSAALLAGLRRGEGVGMEWDRVDLDADVFDIGWQLQRLPFKHGCGDDKDGVWPCGRKRGGSCPDREFDVRDDYVYRQAHLGLAWTRPKSLKGQRLIPIVPSLHAALEQRHEAYEAERGGYEHDHGLVWPLPTGRPIDPKNDTAAWDGICRAAGVPDVELHSARHTTGTLLLEAGVDPLVVQQILGHMDITTSQRYQHVDQRMTREALLKVEQLLTIEG